VRAARGSQSIVYRGKVIVRIRERNDLPGPVELLGLTPDRRWVLYTTDPYSSSSIAADGLMLRAVPTSGGPGRVVAVGRLYADYRAWCGRGLVMTAGFDRIATHHKRLVVATPPSWRTRLLVRARARAWGSLACAPDQRSIVVQSQRESDDANFFHTHWALWRVGLDGSLEQLTRPPHGYADESPRFSRDGRTIMFVRSRRGVGKLYALRDGKLVGPLLSLGYSLGYYGHEDWWQSMSWSLASPRD
jgi:hypothetical protein